MAVIIIAVLTVLTGVFLRIFLDKPLPLLEKVANSYSAGSYITQDGDMPVKEFMPFLSILGRMGETINEQMTALKKSEKKNRGVFENAVEGIFKSTVSGNQVSVNPAMVELLGYDSEADLIKGITDAKS